ncbi:MAG: hypothetical protein SynsKO_07770 [Synoicihabitans sp.]
MPFLAIDATGQVFSQGVWNTWRLTPHRAMALDFTFLTSSATLIFNLSRESAPLPYEEENRLKIRVQKIADEIRDR